MKKTQKTVWVATEGESGGDGVVITGVFTKKEDAVTNALSQKPPYGPWEAKGEDRWQSGGDFVEVSEYPVQ